MRLTSTRRPMGLAVLGLAFVALPAPSAVGESPTAQNAIVITRDSNRVSGQLEGKYFQPEVTPVAERYPAERVGRIHRGGSPARSTDASAQNTTSEVRVPANQPWTQTGVSVRQGDRLMFSASGQIALSTTPDDIAGPAGAHSGRKAPGAPVPGNSAGTLIARVGNARPFAIGDITTPITMPSGGVLFLGINDDGFNDNSGEFVVRITQLRRR